MSSDMLSVINELKSTIANLEAMVATATGQVETVVNKRGRPSKKASTAVEKPKRAPNAWILFNTRIDTLMKETEMTFKRVAEAKQFASKLKKEKAPADWTDDEILAARNEWAETHAILCPVCKIKVKDNPIQHNVCGRNFAEEYEKAGKGTFTQGITEWAKLAGMGDLLEEETVITVKKKPGRPKMTEDEKETAKMERAAKKGGGIDIGPPPATPKNAWAE